MSTTQDDARPPSGTPITFGPYDYIVPAGQDVFRPLYDSISHLRELTDHAIRTFKERPRRGRTDPVAAFLIGSLELSSTGARAAQILAMHGLAEEGQLHVRSICECTIRAAYVLALPECARGLARRWFAFHHYIQLRHALTAQEFPGAGQAPGRLQACIVRLERGCDRLDSLLCFPGRDVWSKEAFFNPDNPARGLRPPKMAKLGGQANLYRLLYFPANDSIHATSMKLARRIDRRKNGENPGEVLIGAEYALKHLLRIADDYLCLGVRERIEELSQVANEAARNLSPPESADRRAMSTQDSLDAPRRR